MLTIFAIIIYIKSPDKKSLALGEAQGRGGGNQRIPETINCFENTLTQKCLECTEYY